MTLKSIRGIVAGTGFEGRAARIRRFCGNGAEIDLRREPHNPHDAEAIGVWMRCSIFFGLWKPWAMIGYIQADRADHLAPRLDSGEYKLVRAYVKSFYAPPDVNHPRVSVEIEVDVNDPAKKTRAKKAGPRLA
ncbi:MAG: HIRAN domain-containing protein [Polaromonas sp.]|nr:HIRAN domain-containing protein [Polaromonas sp.]